MNLIVPTYLFFLAYQIFHFTPSINLTDLKQTVAIYGVPNGKTVFNYFS